MDESGKDTTTGDAAERWLRSKGESSPETKGLFETCKSVLNLADGLLKQNDPGLKNRLALELGITLDPFANIDMENQIYSVESDFRNVPFKESFLKVGDQEIEFVEVQRWSDEGDGYREVKESIKQILGDTETYEIGLRLKPLSGQPEGDFQKDSYIIGANGKIAKMRYLDTQEAEGALEFIPQVSANELELIKTVTMILRDQLGEVTEATVL